jgi:hypothetical protein
MIFVKKRHFKKKTSKKIFASGMTKKQKTNSVRSNLVRGGFGIILNRDIDLFICRKPQIKIKHEIKINKNAIVDF